MSVDSSLPPSCPCVLRAVSFSQSGALCLYEGWRLQRRRGATSKEVMCFNAKLKILEHRQQRIAEVRAKYEWLMKELEATKQYLMLDPNKWLREFDLEQVLQLDSLEYLEALEGVTERLESRVNFCKAHLMMITCFDITSRRR